jgi:hypothetical protein
MKQEEIESIKLSGAKDRLKCVADAKICRAKELLENSVKFDFKSFYEDIAIAIDLIKDAEQLMREHSIMDIEENK